MRRQFLFLSMLIVGIGSALAQYTWKGGDTFDATSWAVQDNWEGTISGNGPGTTGSNCWGVINISGTEDTRITGTTPELEGWNPKMVLYNASVTIPGMKKLQVGVGGEGYFTLTGNSLLELTFAPSGTPNMNDFNVNLLTGDGTFNFILGTSYTGNGNSTGSVGPVVNYGTVSNNMSRKIQIFSSDGDPHSVGKVEINASLPEDMYSEQATLNSATIMKTSRMVVGNKIYNITANGFIEASAEMNLSTDLENNIGKYKVVEVVEDWETSVQLQWVTGPVTFHNITFNYTATFEDGNTYVTSVTGKYPEGTELTSAPDVNIDFYTVEPINHTVTEDATVDVTLTPAFPFVHNKATWLSGVGSATNGGLRQVQYTSDNQINVDKAGTSKFVSKKNTWTFVHVDGTENQFLIMNGLGKYLNALVGGADGTAECTVSEAPQAFTILKSAVTNNNTDTETGFCIKVEDNSFIGLHCGGGNNQVTGIGNISSWFSDQLGRWKDSSSSVSGNGNLFYAIELSDDELSAIAWDYVHVTMSDAVTSRSIISPTGIESGTRVSTSITNGDYNTVWTFLATSTLGKYNIKNEYSGFYLGSADEVNLVEDIAWAGAYEIVDLDNQKRIRIGNEGDYKYLALDGENNLCNSSSPTIWNVYEVSSVDLQELRNSFENDRERTWESVNSKVITYVGTGVGKYTPTEDQAATIQTAKDLDGNMSNLSGNDIDKKLNAAGNLFNVGIMSINQPATGFYRIVYQKNVDTPFIGSTGGNDGSNTIDMTAEENASSIVYIEEGEEGKKYLMMYDNGYYIANPFRYGIGSEIIQNSEIYKQPWTVEEGLFGLYALKYGSGYYITGNTNKLGYSSDKSENANCWKFLTVNKLPLVTNAEGYATFSAPVPVRIPENCYAYVATDKGNGVVNMSKVTGDVAANTGMIIKTPEPSTKLSFEVVETGETYDNKLVANVAAAKVDKADNYFFGKYGEEYVFTKIDGEGSRELKGHKAYLDGIGLAGARLFVSWDGETVTGIDTIVGEKFVPGNGKYVEDGRVVIVKDGFRYTSSGQRIK